MRMTEIDGQTYEIHGCTECPFIQSDGEFETCRYPVLNSFLIGRLDWHNSKDAVPDDCPLPDPKPSRD